MRKSQALYAARKGNHELWHVTEAEDFKLVTLFQVCQESAQALDAPQVALSCTPALLCLPQTRLLHHKKLLPSFQSALPSGQGEPEGSRRRGINDTRPWSLGEGRKHRTEQLSVILQGCTSVCPTSWCLRVLKWLKTPLGILFRDVTPLAPALLQGLKWTHQHSWLPKPTIAFLHLHTMIPRCPKIQNPHLCLTPFLQTLISKTEVCVTKSESSLVVFVLSNFVTQVASVQGWKHTLTFTLPWETQGIGVLQWRGNLNSFQSWTKVWEKKTFPLKSLSCQCWPQNFSLSYYY